MAIAAVIAMLITDVDIPIDQASQESVSTIGSHLIRDVIERINEAITNIPFHFVLIHCFI